MTCRFRRAFFSHQIPLMSEASVWFLKSVQRCHLEHWKGNQGISQCCGTPFYNCISLKDKCKWTLSADAVQLCHKTISNILLVLFVLELVQSPLKCPGKLCVCVCVYHDYIVLLNIIITYLPLSHVRRPVVDCLFTAVQRNSLMVSLML